MNSEVSLIAVARIIKPFGLRGEVKLHLLADLKDFLEYPEFFVKEKFFYKRLILVGIRSQGKVAHFEGYASREDAETLRGKTLYIKEEHLIKKNRVNEFYPFELEGLSVVFGDMVLGIVSRMLNFNGRWYIEVGGEKDILIPFVRPLVNRVDWEGKKIFVDLPEGYLEL